MPDIKTVGVIGAGQMGSGIAHVCAVAGYDVTLLDVSQEQLDSAISTIEKNLHRQANRGKVDPATIAPTIARISKTQDYADLKSADVVIEAATEKEEVKREIFKTLVPHLSETAIVCSNTSTISITRLASVTDRPGRFMGMHFMNPVPLMQLIELIRGIATDEDTFQAIRELSERLGKTVASAEDFPAFIVNRLLLPMINAAVYTLYEGVGNV